MSKKIFCDICKKEVDHEGSHHLDIQILGRVVKWFSMKVVDDRQLDMDICRNCWKTIFNLKEVQSILPQGNSNEK